MSVTYGFSCLFIVDQLSYLFDIEVLPIVVCKLVFLLYVKHLFEVTVGFITNLKVCRRQSVKLIGQVFLLPEVFLQLTGIHLIFFLKLFNNLEKVSLMPN